MRSILPTWLLMLVGSSLWNASCPARADDLADFQPQTDFLKLPDGWTLGACSAVAVSGKGEIYLFHRGKLRSSALIARAITFARGATI